MKFTKTILIALFAFLGTASFSHAQSTDSATVVSVEVFEKMAQKKRKTVVIDVRTPEEVASGYLANSTNIDVQNELFDLNISELNKNKTYLLYCRSGKRTAVAGAKMKAAGFKKVYMMDGGMNSWNKQGKPVTNGKN
jgi:rhodanese-related sulfurtransferase